MNQKLIYYKIDRKNEKKIKESVFFFFSSKWECSIAHWS